MQERRTTIRMGHRVRVQYCAAEDLVPRDGRLANISERGVGLLTHETHREHEPITVSFSLPGFGEPLTATGSVRWSAHGRHRWYATGLEWLPMEDDARRRLHAFLYETATPAAPAVARAAEPPRAPAAQGARMWWIAGALIVAIIGAVIWQLHRDARELQRAIAQRDAVIGQLRQREQRLADHEAQLQQELDTAKSHLAVAASEVSRLDAQAGQLAADAKRLNQEVRLFQASYDQVQQEREQLMRQVLNLEQEKLDLTRRLTSIPDLQTAIREAIAARKTAEKQAQGVEPRLLDFDIRPGDNQGYLVRDGHLTTSVAPATMRIKVYDPTMGGQDAAARSGE